jgi:hypothetical protein
MANPKMKTKVFQPGLEIEHEVGLTGVGVTIVHTTVAVNTARTAAQLLASPANTSTIQSVGPVVHSLGAPPSFASMQEISDGAPVAEGPVVFQYCTADNSAVYFWPQSFSAAPAVARVRVVAVR